MGDTTDGNHQKDLESNRAKNEVNKNSETESKNQINTNNDNCVNNKIENSAKNESEANDKIENIAKDESQAKNKIENSADIDLSSANNEINAIKNESQVNNKIESSTETENRDPNNAKNQIDGVLGTKEETGNGNGLSHEEKKEENIAASDEALHPMNITNGSHNKSDSQDETIPTPVKKKSNCNMNINGKKVPKQNGRGKKSSKGSGNSGKMPKLSRGHQLDDSKDWEFRTPPRGVAEYSLCRIFSSEGVCRLGSQCTEAHSEEELKEWKRRFQIRQAKANKNTVMFGRSFVDTVLEKVYALKGSVQKVLASQVEHVKCMVNRPLDAKISEKGQKVSYTFTLETSNQILQNVALLNSENCKFFSLESIKHYAKNGTVERAGVDTKSEIMKTFPIDCTDDNALQVIFIKLVHAQFLDGVKVAL